MAILIETEFGDDNELMCSACEAIFVLTFHRSVVNDGINFCPFCSDQIEEELDYAGEE